MHRVEEALDLDVIVDADTGEMPLGIFVVVLRQRLHKRPFDRLEQLASAHAKAPHLAAVHPLHGVGDGGVALSQGEERDVAQPAKDIGLCKAYPRFDRGLIPRAFRPGWQDADAVMRRHRRIPHDLRAIGETIELVEAVKKPMVFIVNNASTNGRLTLQAVTARSKYGTVAPTVVHTRQDYGSSMIKGRVAGEASPKGKSAAEIAELWAYIESRLNKEMQYGAAA